MCRRARIEGYKTNHYLRATTATHLFRAGVDEQLIMERNLESGWCAQLQTN